METKNEKIFYQDSTVTVSQARFIAEAKTYAVSNISSVSTFKVKRSRMFEIILIIIGIIMLFNKNAWFAGVAVIGFAILLYFLLKDKYYVKISSNSGEAKALESTNKDYVNKIVEALNEAIIHRG